MSDQAAENKETPPPGAPALGELFELSLTALVNAQGVFAKLEARPIPGPGASLLMALAWGALFFALNLIHVAISSPAALQAYAPWMVACVGFLGLSIWTALYLLGASFVYGLGRALGTAGDFDRALLIAAVTLAAAPVQALCSWLPMAWIPPTIVAAWTLACGLSALFKANPWAARGVCAMLAAGLLALQYGAGLIVEKYSATAQLAAVAARSMPSASQLAALQQQMQQVQAISTEMKQDTQNAQPGQSSLDLLRVPGDSDVPSAAPTQMQQLAQTSAQGDALEKSVDSMLDSLLPMLNNPAITQNMTPQQKMDHAELTKMIQSLKKGMASNATSSPQEEQAQMMKIQQLLMRAMNAGMTMPKPQTPPADSPKAKQPPAGAKK